MVKYNQNLRRMKICSKRSSFFTGFFNDVVDLIVALEVLNQEEDWTIKLKETIEKVEINHK